MNNPKVSVITINFNDVKGLKLTIESVLKQNYKEFEYIVIDGGSTDGSVMLLESYKISFIKNNIEFKYISEKDDGIYDAMNKGIDIAQGIWLNFMNSGDYYYSEKVLSNIFNENNFNSTDIIYGKWKKINKDQLLDGDVYYSDRVTNINELDKSKLKPYPSKGAMFTAHLAMFFRSDLMKSRKYNLHYNITADFEWCMNAYDENRSFTFVDEYVCIFNLNGISNIELFSTYKEVVEIRHKYGTQDPIIIEKAKILIWFLLDKFKKKR